MNLIFTIENKIPRINIDIKKVKKVIKFIIKVEIKNEIFLEELLKKKNRFPKSYCKFL